MAVALSPAEAVPPEPRRLHAFLVRYPRIAGALAVAIGSVTVLGWIADIPRLTHPIPSLPIMVPNTAIMSVLAGLSLWLHRGAQRARVIRVISRVAAGGAALLAVATLLEYAAGADLGIDRLIPSGQAGPWPAGRPSPQTIAAFVCIAAALLVLDRRRVGRRHPSEVLAVVASAIAIVALLGYLFGVPAMYGPRTVQIYVAMSVPTALVVLTLALGILTVDLDRGMLSIVIARDAGGIVARRLLVGLAALPLIAIAVIIGARLRWYAFPVASALVLFFALAEGSVFIIATARRLSRFDAAQRMISNEQSASEARVRTLVEQAPDGIFLADLDGRYIDVNPAGCAMLGYRRDELIGLTIADVIQPAELPRLERERSIVMTGGTARGEWELRRKDGSSIEAEVVASVLSDGRWQAITRDITERKRNTRLLAEAFEAERALRADLEAVDAARAAVVDALTHLQGAEIEPVLRQIAEQARSLTSADYSVVAIGVDPTQPFEHWVPAGVSDEVARAIGRRPRPVGVLRYAIDHTAPIRLRDVTTHPSFRGLPPHHFSIGSFLAMPIQRSGQAIGNLYVANKRGAAEFSDRDERVVGLLADGLARAIETGRGYAAESARRVWLQSILDQLPQGVAVIDNHEQITAINRALKAWALDPRLPEQVALGNQRMFDVRDLEGKLVPAEEFPIARAMRTGEATPDQELLLGQADGRMLPIETRAAPIRDEAGRVTGAVVVVRDVTERKEFERLREEWIAVVAHELRQPVSAMVSASGILYDKLAPGREPEILEGLREAALRLNRMVEDLLDVARIAANRLSVELTNVDLVETVTHAIEQVRLAHPDVELVLDAPASQLTRIDHARIEQVLGNLLSNAIKYRKPGTKVRVEVRQTDNRVRVGVHNEGTPIDPEELPRLFARFERTRDARASGLRGVGLGLYICKGLIEAHGGRIWIDSQAGRTSVYFTVPALASEASPVSAS